RYRNPHPPADSAGPTPNAGGALGALRRDPRERPAHQRRGLRRGDGERAREAAREARGRVAADLSSARRAKSPRSCPPLRARLEALAAGGSHVELSSYSFLCILRVLQDPRPRPLLTARAGHARADAEAQRAAAPS